MIKFEVIGDTQVVANLEDISAKQHAAIVKVMRLLGMDLLERVVDVNLAGVVLKRQTGNLARAQVPTFVDTNEEISLCGFTKVMDGEGRHDEIERSSW